MTNSIKKSAIVLLAVAILGATIAMPVFAQDNKGQSISSKIHNSINNGAFRVFGNIAGDIIGRAQSDDNMPAFSVNLFANDSSIKSARTTYNQEIKNIRAFLYKVAVNLIIDNSRKKKMLSLDEMENSISSKDNGGSVRQYTVEGEIFNKFDSGEIVKLLDKLTDNYRQVITMRYIDELLPSEIADILDETPNAISVRLNQAMARLRQVIKEKENER